MPARYVVEYLLFSTNNSNDLQHNCIMLGPLCFCEAISAATASCLSVRLAVSLSVRDIQVSE